MMRYLDELLCMVNRAIAFEFVHENSCPRASIDCTQAQKLERGIAEFGANRAL